MRSQQRAVTNLLPARRSPLTGRARKRPWRYRWPDDIRDEVLARLLKLNAERAKEEQLAGMTVAATAQPKRRKGERANRRGAGAGAGRFSPAGAERFVLLNWRAACR